MLLPNLRSGVVLWLFPFMYYETYGDDSLIKKYYPNMRRYVDYLKTRADKGILLSDWETGMITEIFVRDSHGIRPFLWWLLRIIT